MMLFLSIKHPKLLIWIPIFIIALILLKYAGVMEEKEKYYVWRTELSYDNDIDDSEDEAYFPKLGY